MTECVELVAKLSKCADFCLHCESKSWKFMCKRSQLTCGCWSWLDKVCCCFLVQINDGTESNWWQQLGNGWGIWNTLQIEIQSIAALHEQMLICLVATHLWSGEAVIKMFIKSSPSFVTSIDNQSEHFPFNIIGNVLIPAKHYDKALLHLFVVLAVLSSFQVLCWKWSDNFNWKSLVGDIQTSAQSFC